jgi:hypothetical protein
MRYLAALDANLELHAVFPDRSAQLYLLADAEAGDDATQDDSAHEAPATVS